MISNPLSDFHTCIRTRWHSRQVNRQIWVAKIRRRDFAWFKTSRNRANLPFINMKKVNKRRRWVVETWKIRSHWCVAKTVSITWLEERVTSSWKWSNSKWLQTKMSNLRKFMAWQKPLNMKDRTWTLNSRHRLSSQRI